MTAHDKFKVGQRVRMTKEALDAGLDGPIAKRSVGVVRGFPRREMNAVRGECVRILRDGDKSAKTYHMDYWEPVE